MTYYSQKKQFQYLSVETITKLFIDHYAVNLHTVQPVHSVSHIIQNQLIHESRFARG